MTTHTHKHAANHHDVAIDRSHAHSIHVGQCNTVDAIIAVSGLPAATVSSRLLSLELGRHVRSAPGNRIIKLI